MDNLRAGLRLLGFAFFTGLMVLIFCLGLPFCIIFKNGRARWKTVLIRRWARLMSVVIGLKIKIEGKRPDPPFFLVSNHLSYLDILPFWGYLKTTFVAKNEIKKWPFIGFAARTLGILFINRQRSRDLSRVNKLIAHEINDHQGIILFPEGTSSKGEEVLPFKSSLLNFPASNKIPVHYASISYRVLNQASHNASDELCWWGDMDFMDHFWNMLKIKSSAVTVRFGDAVHKNEDRKVLTESLQQAVEENFTPTATGS